MLTIPLREERRPRAVRRGVFCCPRTGVPVRRPRACSPRVGASYGGPNVALRVRDGGGNVVEASRVWDVLRGLPDVTSIERDEMRIMVEGSRA